MKRPERLIVVCIDTIDTALLGGIPALERLRDELAACYSESLPSDLLLSLQTLMQGLENAILLSEGTKKITSYYDQTSIRAGITSAKKGRLV